MRAEALTILEPKMVFEEHPGLGKVREERTPSPLQRSAMLVLAAHKEMVEAEIKQDAAFQEFLSRTAGMPFVPGGHSKSLKDIHMAMRSYISKVKRGNAYSLAKPKQPVYDELHTAMVKAGFSKTNFSAALEFAFILFNGVRNI